MHHAYQAAIEVNVSPLKSKGLALAQTQRQRDWVERLESIAADLREKSPRLFRVEGSYLVLWTARRLDEHGDIPGNHPHRTAWLSAARSVPRM
jgi:hypothetical protein